MNKEKLPHAKTCPHCENDTFSVAKTWYGTERYVQNKENLRTTIELVDEKQYEYLAVECQQCGIETTIEALLEQPYH